jgi:hypothetical protein
MEHMKKWVEKMNSSTKIQKHIKTQKIKYANASTWLQMFFELQK